MSNRRFATIASVLLIGTIASVVLGNFANPFAAAGFTPLAVPLDQFPEQAGGWRMIGEEPLTERELEVSGADRHIRRFYQAADGSVVQLYVLYIGNRERGLRTIYHNPTVCMPMAGWTVEREERRRVVLDDVARQFEVALYRFQRGARKATILSFFVIDGEPTVNPRNDPMELARQKLALSSSAGYFVQVQIVPLSTPEGQDPADLAVRFLKHTGRHVFLHF